jgi:hypothetical protein
MNIERGIERGRNTKSGEQRFRARYFVGYDATGKRVYRARSFATLEEARQWYILRRLDREPSPNADLEQQRWDRYDPAGARG